MPNKVSIRNYSITRGYTPNYGIYRKRHWGGSCKSKITNGTYPSVTLQDICRSHLKPVLILLSFYQEFVILLSVIPICFILTATHRPSCKVFVSIEEITLSTTWAIGAGTLKPQIKPFCHNNNPFPNLNYHWDMYRIPDCILPDGFQYPDWLLPDKSRNFQSQLNLHLPRYSCIY